MEATRTLYKVQIPPELEVTRTGRQPSTQRRSGPSRVDTSFLFAAAVEKHFSVKNWSFRLDPVRDLQPLPLPPLARTKVPSDIIIEHYKNYQIHSSSNQANRPSSSEHAPGNSPSLKLASIARDLWKKTTTENNFKDEKNFAYNSRKLAWLLEVLDQPALPIRILPQSPPNGFSADFWKCVLDSATRALKNNAIRKARQYKRLLSALPKRLRRFPRSLQGL